METEKGEPRAIIESPMDAIQSEDEEVHPPNDQTKRPKKEVKPPRTADNPPRTADKPQQHTVQSPKKTAQKPMQPIQPTKQPTQPATQPTQPAKQPVQQGKRPVQPPKKSVQIQRQAERSKNYRTTKPASDDGFLTRMRALSAIWKIASTSFLIGFLFNVIAYATPHWLDTVDAAGSDVGMGLWSSCTTISDCEFRGVASNCLNTLRGFGGVAVLLCLLVCPLLGMYVNRPSQRRCVAITVIIVCSITALCIQIVTASFTRTSGCSDSGSGGHWSWSLACSVVAILFISAAAVLFFVQELRVCSAYRKGQNPHRTLGPGIRVT